MPSMISGDGCNQIQIDLSSSTGSGGRQWSTILFSILSSSYNEDLTNVTRILNSFTKTATTTTADSSASSSSLLFSLPSSILMKGTTYTIQAQLCNFLSSCSTSSSSVYVTNSADIVPFVVILGSQQRVINLHNDLLLSTLAYTQDCKGVKSYQNLHYSWLVYDDNNRIVTSITSQSVDPKKFKLSAYSFNLITLKYYKIMVTVHTMSNDIITSSSSSSSITIYVSQSSIISQLKGGYQQSIRIGQSLTLDASLSYDEDIFDKTGKEAGLLFTWSCYQLSPIFSLSCPLTTLQGTTESEEYSSSLETWPIFATDKSSNTTSKIQVRVYDSIKSRSSTSYVIVKTLGASSPKVSILTNNKDITNINIAQKLVLTAEVETIHISSHSSSSFSSSCIAKWSVDQSSDFIFSNSLSPSTYIIAKDSISTIHLVLAPYSLPVRSSLLFTLSCGSTTASSSSSSSSIVVTTNGPPLPGQFIISPREGYELETIFIFMASLWTDNDIPISYQFGFVSGNSGRSSSSSGSSSDSVLVLQGRSELSSTSSTLGSGDVTGSVEVFDNLGASMIANNFVSVSIQVNRSLDELHSTIINQLDINSGNNDGTKSILSVASSILNKVNCTLAPNCNDLNRYPCSDTTQTCGICYNSYFGIFGSSNSKCIAIKSRKLVDTSTNNTTTITIISKSETSTSCLNDDDCHNWEICDKSSTVSTSVGINVTTIAQCVIPNKKCINDCSNHGECTLININTRKKIGSSSSISSSNICLITDDSCQAICVCNNNYTGVNCDVSMEIMMKNQFLRYQLLDTLSSIIKSDDINKNNIIAWCNSLQSLLQDPYQISINMSTIIYSTLSYIIKHAENLSINYESLISILNIANTFTTFQLNHQQQYVNYNNIFNSSNITNNDYSNALQILNAISHFNDMILSQTVINEHSIESIIFQAFRSISLTKSISMNSDSINVQIPTTFMEKYNKDKNINASSISIIRNSKSSSILNNPVSIYLISTASALYGTNSHEFTANPLKFKISSSPTTTSSGSSSTSLSDTATESINVTISLIHHDKIDFTNTYYQDDMIFTTICSFNKSLLTYNYTCPVSQKIISHTCQNGFIGTKISYCPIIQSSCKVLDNYDNNNLVSGGYKNKIDCSLLSYNQYSTLCNCHIQPSYSSQSSLIRNRQLQSMENSVIDIELNIVSSTEFVAKDNKETIESASSLTSPSQFKQVLIIIVMFLTLWSSGLLLIFSCIWRRQMTRKFNLELQNELELKKAKAVDSAHSATVLHQYLADYISKVLPSVFSNKPFLSRMINEIKTHHRYLTLLTAPIGEVGDKNRILSGIQLLTIQTMLMFLLAVFYDLLNPGDDGSCNSLYTYNDCIQRKSVLDSHQSYCSWVDSSTTTTTSSSNSIDYDNTMNILSNKCEYRDVNYTLQIVLTISIMVSIVVACISKPLDMIFNVLKAPVADDVKVIKSKDNDDDNDDNNINRTDKNAVNRFGRRFSNAVRRMSNMITNVAYETGYKLRLIHRSVGDDVMVIPLTIEFSHALASSSINKMMHTYVHKIRQHHLHRLHLYHKSMKSHINYDDDDNDSDGDDSSDSSNSSTDNDVHDINDGNICNKTSIRPAAATTTTTSNDNSIHNIDNASTIDLMLEKLIEQVLSQRKFIKEDDLIDYDQQWGIDNINGNLKNSNYDDSSNYRRNNNRETTYEILKNELNLVQTISNEKIKKLQIATDAHVGLEIIHLFIKDLLGRTTSAAKIFESKNNEDFHHLQVVSKKMKMIALFLLLLINLVFIYYSILTGYHKGYSWQIMYLYACIGQFFIEIFLFETIECIWLNCFIPLLVSNDIQSISNDINELIYKLCLHEIKGTKYFLNSPDYLFISTKVAKKFPTLLESIIVQSYHTHLPGYLSKQWQSSTHHQQQYYQTSTTTASTKVLMSRILSSLSFLFIILQYFGAAPFIIHRFFIRFIQPFILSGCVFIWTYIMLNTIYLIITIVIILIIIIMIVYRYMLDQKKISLIQPITPIQDESGHNDDNHDDIDDEDENDDDNYNFNERSNEDFNGSSSVNMIDHSSNNYIKFQKKEKVFKVHSSSNGSSNSIFDVDDDCVDIHNDSCNDIIISENSSSSRNGSEINYDSISEISSYDNDDKNHQNGNKKTVGCNIKIMSHEDRIIKSDNVEYGITTNDKKKIGRQRNVNNGDVSYDDDDEDDEDDDKNMSVVSSIDSYTSSIRDIIVAISNSYVGIELSDGRSSSSVVVNDDDVVDHDGLEDEDVLVSSEESDYEKDDDDDDDCDDEKEVEDKFSEMESDDLSADSRVISYR